MKRCIIESPFAAPKHLRDAAEVATQTLKVDDTAAAWHAALVADAAVDAAVNRHRQYLKHLGVFLMYQGYAPFASHGIYTYWLDDNDADQRKLGMNAVLPWAKVADTAFFGVDCGISSGMRWGWKQHTRYTTQQSIHVYAVELGTNWETTPPSEYKASCIRPLTLDEVALLEAV